MSIHHSRQLLLYYYPPFYFLRFRCLGVDLRLCFSTVINLTSTSVNFIFIILMRHWYYMYVLDCLLWEVFFFLPVIEFQIIYFFVIYICCSWFFFPSLQFSMHPTIVVANLHKVQKGKQTFAHLSCRQTHIEQ